MHKGKQNPRIIFRAVGSNKIGLGHIVRCMALAEMLGESFDTIFWLNKPDDIIVEMVRPGFNFKVFDFDNNEEEIEELKSELRDTDILVLDGYQFDGEYQHSLKPYVKKMVCIDDLAGTHFYADLIINHGDGMRTKRYDAEVYTKILTGADYVILREPFRKAAIKSRMGIEKIDTVFICMGGADPFNATNKVLRSCLLHVFIKKIVIVIGSAYSFHEEMDRIISTAIPGKEVLIKKNISDKEIVDLLYSSQLAICPASSIALEVTSVKCGLLTGIVVDNQVATHDMLIQAGCAITVGSFNEISEEGLSLKIEEMNNVGLVNNLIVRQASFIDGLSGKRLIDEFNAFNVC